MSSEATSISGTDLVCSSCESSVSDVRLSFKCDTCFSTDQENKLEDTAMSPAMPVFCDICIFPHIRKNHTVLDYKNMEVIVCDDHKLNCDKFCKTCGKLICLKCVEDHYKENHSIISVEEKASEIKKIIHEAISENDKNYKPMAVKLGTQKFSAGDFHDLKEKIGEEVLFKNLSETFKECFDDHLTKISQIREQMKFVADNLQSEIKQSESCLESIDSKQTSLRCLLGLSEARLVNDSIKTNNLQNALEPVKKDDEQSSTQEFACKFKKTFDDQKLEFANSLKANLEKYFSRLNLTLIERHFSVQGVSIFGHYTSKIEVACSDTLLCIAMLKDDKKSVDVEFFNGIDESVHKRTITADHEHFKLFSCYGGIVARFHADTYGVFRTRNGSAYLSNKWKYTSDVTGFVFNEDGNIYTAYNLYNARLHFQSGYDDLDFQPDVSGVLISATIKLPQSLVAISCCSGYKNRLILPHEKFQGREMDCLSVPDFPSVMHEVKIEQSATDFVAVGFDRLSRKFALVQLDSELEPSEETLQVKKFDLDKKIRYDIYFNSSAYLVTEDGYILKIPNLLNLR